MSASYPAPSVVSLSTLSVLSLKFRSKSWVTCAVIRPMKWSCCWLGRFTNQIASPWLLQSSFWISFQCLCAWWSSSSLSIWLLPCYCSHPCGSCRPQSSDACSCERSDCPILCFWYWAKISSYSFHLSFYLLDRTDGLSSVISWCPISGCLRLSCRDQN